MCPQNKLGPASSVSHMCLCGNGWHPNSAMCDKGAQTDPEGRGWLETLFFFLERVTVWGRAISYLASTKNVGKQRKIGLSVSAQLLWKTLVTKICIQWIKFSPRFYSWLFLLKKKQFFCCIYYKSRGKDTANGSAWAKRMQQVVCVISLDESFSTPFHACPLSCPPPALWTLFSLNTVRPDILHVCICTGAFWSTPQTISIAKDFPSSKYQFLLLAPSSA